MALYGLLESGVFNGEIRNFDTTPPNVTHKNLEWRTFISVDQPVYDAIANDIVHSADVSPTEITETWTIVSVDASTQTQRQLTDDTILLQQAQADSVLVLVELVDYLLANTAMEQTDFSVDVNQLYVDMKVIVDRIKSA